MSKISREDNKKRYKTGMYPTQQDFENVFDSYVHKDDTIDPSKIVSGDENIVDIINRKAEEKHSHEIADVDGLQTFIDEMTSLLEIVRDPETGEISQSKLKDITDSLTALRDDIDTNTDNIAGHESRIQTNEAALEKVYQILGKDAKESIADLADRFTALSGNYANVYAFINKVKQFLEDADASDETINRWQEIETFLQGITDTQTLTGLLADLKAEIQAEIPQGNYLKQIADLDGYTDAQDGEIVQYVGQTNDQYTRGFLYEKVVSGGGTRSVGTVVNGGTSTLAVGTKFVLQADPATSYWKGSTSSKEVGGIYSLETFKKPEVGDIIYSLDGNTPPTGLIGWEVLKVTESNNELTVQVFKKNQGVGYVTMTEYTNAYVLKSYSDDELLGYKTNSLYKIGDQYCWIGYSSETEEIPASDSWQHLHPDNVIN